MNAELLRPDLLATVQLVRKQAYSRVCTPGFTRVVYLPQCGETTTAKRDDLHSKSSFLVKNKGQWNAKSGPKAAYGNFAMRTQFSGRMDLK